MLWLRLLTYAGLVVFALFFVTQVLIPLLFNRRVFPLFNKSETKLESNIVDAHQQIHEADLEADFIQLQRELTEKRAAFATVSEPEPITKEVPATPEVVAPVVEQTPQAAPAPKKRRGRKPKTDKQ